MVSPLMISVIVLQSLITTPKSPSNSTVKPSTTLTLTVTTTLIDLLRRTSYKPSTWLNIRLVNKKGLSLVMFTNGSIAGTWNISLAILYGIFRIQSHGPSIVKLRSLATRKYIAINSRGKVYSTANSSTEEALLKHAQEENHFFSFSSYKYSTGTYPMRNWLLAIGSHGRMRNASRVLIRHKSHQFQIKEV